MNHKEPNSKEARLKNTHVPDKVYAYSLQVRHALFELLDCTDSEIVSIEVFDDIAIEKDDGSIEAVQLKSVLSNNNPISDRAVDLWKTLYNWLIAVQEGELDPDKTIFKLFIAADRKGNIVKLFSNANCSTKAEEVWKKARTEFYDDTGNEKSMGDQYSLFVRGFFNPVNKSSACNIIKNFKLVTIDSSHTTALYNKFCQKAIIPDELVEYAFDYILGWIDKKTAKLIETTHVMSISYSEYKAQLVAITRELNQKLSLKELAPRPSKEDIENELVILKNYLGQLDLIECDYTDKIEAISDYLRASINRTIWASHGDISESNLLIYEEELVKKWNNKRKIINLTEKSLSPEEKGNLLYLRCKDDSLNIDYLSVPGFFTPGCYHALSDDLIIGWHPEYKKLFKIGCEKDGTSE
ncbi:hypothetical protein KDN24_02205 [Bacillus sp. Bva_UNVM-123]|uniref:ABC-three component system protein n=1 Tax=Bacillus sp. Bva_UNVM-123 TaxID=2829798 RepID=UPI00391FBEC3